LIGGKIVYLDRNIFADLYRHRGDVSAQDVERLRTLVEANDVLIPLSHTLVQETAELYRTNPEQAIQELRWLVSFTMERRVPAEAKIVKYPRDLVDGDIKAYANGHAKPSPHQMVDLRRLLNPSLFDHPYFVEMIDLGAKHKREFFEYSKAFRQNLLPKGEHGRVISGNIQLEPDARRSFDEYFAEHAEAFADGLVERAGVQDLVRARGLRGLLRASKAVLLAVGAGLSQGYAWMIEDRAPHGGEFFDQHHAVSAVTAEIFVTRDKEFARRLQRVPIDNFEVLIAEEFWDRARSSH
jgi:hypothetical protein